MTNDSNWGGILALRGFDYQATVILDRLFAHFDQYGMSATARPEGADDLDLGWVSADGSLRFRFEQIKKPREDRNGKPNGKRWTLPQIARELIPGALANLEGTANEQVWILGDKVGANVSRLVAAGPEAPSREPAAYWRVVHLLSRDIALKTADIGKTARGKLVRWPIPAGLPRVADAALARLTEGFRQRAHALGVNDTVADRHAAAAKRFHACLPDVLARIRIERPLGSEEEVALRVRERLESRYGLKPAVVESTLFRNLRGFINDIAKQPGRRFGREEFEFELRSVWPLMSPVRNVPLLEEDHVRRVDLSTRFTTGWSGNALEVLGVSGAGKTMLAAEVHERSQSVDPNRLVFYAEIRSDTELRDALVGITFQLRRLGLAQPFSVAVENTAANEEILGRLGRALSATPKELLLLLDLVQGTCSEAFARDLSTFIASVRSAACRIAVFGQESPFRYLSVMDRERLGVASIDVRGFNVDEFVSMVSRRHPTPDYALIHTIFRRVTAGRSAGLYAKLARSLAEATSLKAMRDLAQRPAHEILEMAEQQRFNRVSGGARSAAEKLVCFALPFGRPEAEDVFADDNVGAAIRELLALGLLRVTAHDSYEMHEIVRAGLEGMISVRTRRDAHGALAAHYRQQGEIAAEVLHLERAGRLDEARERARATFLRGEHWAALAGFVVAHELVTPSEVLRVMASPVKVDSAYLLSDVLSQLSSPAGAHEILAVLLGQPQRFLSEYEWSSALVGACLSIEPNRLHELIQFGLSIQRDSKTPDTELDLILIAARRHGCNITPETLSLFDASTDDSKLALLPFLLFDGRREALSRALAFMARDLGEHQDRRKVSWSERYLKVQSREQVIEFLAALPAVPDHVMLALRSPLLGKLTALVWSNRQSLRIHCIDILQAADMEAQVQKAAIRVLVLLAEPRVCELCEALAAQGESAIRGFAMMVPSMAPTLVDRGHYEARLLDAGQDIQVRMVALTILASVGADLGELYERLRAVETGADHLKLWDFLFLQSAARAPFAAGIPLLEAHLQSSETRGAAVSVGALISLGRLPGPAAVTMLLNAIFHADQSVRGAAVIALGDRRSHSALDKLVQRFREEQDKSMNVVLATAIIASGAHSVADLAASPHESVHLYLWRCVLAARTRDATFAPQLVALANDISVNWQLRRAAINAAGFLPFEMALAHMLPVLREHSPLTIDDHQSLGTHSTLSWFLLECGSLLSAFAGDRMGFISLIEGILDDERHHDFDPRGRPPAVAVAGWLYDRLQEHGWPENPAAPDAVINEMLVPLLHSALLRALRRASRTDLIEAELARADHVWMATRCLMELFKASYCHSDSAKAVSELALHPRICDDDRIKHIVDDLTQRRGKGVTEVQVAEAPLRQEGTPLSYENAVQLMAGRTIDSEIGKRAPFVLEALTTAEFGHLVRLADPINDRHSVTEQYVSKITLGRDTHSVAQWRRSYSSASEQPGSWIRPALAVANLHDLPVPWHEELLSGALSGGYVERLLACLAASGDADMFYKLLNRDHELMLPSICSYPGWQQIAPFIDDRMVPILNAHLMSGTDETFEGLCRLARSIGNPSIDEVLSALFRRWRGYFEGWRETGSASVSHHIWRAFRELHEHPRFALITDWFDLLSPVMQAPLAWYHQQDIMRVLERDPRSYLLVEARLFKFEDWAHFYENEIERLEKAAERLFGQVSD